MTSLEFYRPSETIKQTLPDWGTGRLGVEGLWIPRAPTWHTIGLPLDHNYQLTPLLLSNVRDNDELVPRPQAIDITKKCINLPFPAEHPYASHIPKYTVIPNFDSPEDPKRGVGVRELKPIPDEMPANPYDVAIVKKTKGFPYREEIRALPSDGQKDALYWPGEDFFYQQSKIHGNFQQYYPFPPKLLAPNLQERPAVLQLSERSQNALRNIEHYQWIPTQKLDYSGLGPANPMALDNLACKKAVFYQVGEWDDKLYPRSINTFDPARPMEGRLRKLFAPKPAQQIMIESGWAGIPSQKKLTKKDIEEIWLLQGREYVNLPSSPNQDYRLQDKDPQCRPEPVSEHLQTAEKVDNENADMTALHKKSTNYLEAEKELMTKHIQQMQAQNRWKLLETDTPRHDIVQLREKFKILYKKEMPATFYKHEGKYNEERAGLYKTSYDPQLLAYSMNAQELSGAALFNTSQSHVEASKYPTVTWDENEAALKGSHTVVFKKSELSGDRPASSDMLLPYRETVAIQRDLLQPTAATARPRVQEGEFYQKEDTYGESYNVKQFLQENKLDRSIRLVPTDLMSYENQNFERVRERAGPREASSKSGNLKLVHFSDDVHIQNTYKNFPLKIKESHLEFVTDGERDELVKVFRPDEAETTAFSQRHPEISWPDSVIVGDTRNLAENLQKPVAVPTIIARNTQTILKPPFVSFIRNPQLKPPPISETADQFRSLSTNFMPVGIKQEPSLRSSCCTQFPLFNLGEKNDARFDWEPGKGQLKPQSCLMELQDSFIKSEVNKRFYRQFPETIPDLRTHLKGKRRSALTGQPVTFHLQSN